MALSGLNILPRVMPFHYLICAIDKCNDKILVQIKVAYTSNLII
jgi:hypothetical protein